MVLNLLALIQSSSMWRETDAFAFLVQWLQKQEGKKHFLWELEKVSLSQERFLNGISFFASVPVVRRFLFVCLPLEGFTVNLHVLQQK